MERKLANGMTVSYRDQSKKLAGDRWLVRCRCRVSLPLSGWMDQELSGDDPQTVFCREQFGGALAHEMVMERTFIDAADRETVLAELMRSFEENLEGYLARDTFVRQLFAVQRQEFAQRYAEQGWGKEEEGGEPPPEPDDFAACFR